MSDSPEPGKLQTLTKAFHRKVMGDPLLAPVFDQMRQHLAELDAEFLAELLGGPPLHSSGCGSHVGMIVKHLGRGITEAQRGRWLALMFETADEIGLPTADAAFRNAFRAYLEWGWGPTQSSQPE